MDSLLNYFEMGLSSIIPFIILLGVLIFVHELGHFLVARWCGVKVEVFSLGFGKKIFKKKWGDTEYAISLIPLGGYVKMFGDEVGKEVPASERKVSFLHKPVGQRIAIVLAGPIMNLLFAGVVFFFLAWSGEVRRGAELGDIESQSYAYEVGFRSGDLIVAVDDQQVRSWDEVQEVLTHKVNQEVRFQVTRLGFEQPIVVKAVPRLVPNPNPLQLRSEIGAIEGVSLDSWSPVIGVTGKTLAYQMGFRTGDRVVAINDQPIKFFRDLEPKLVALQGAEVTVEILRQQGGSEGHSEAAQEKVTLNIKLPDIMPSLNSFGIEKPLVYIYSVVKDSPAEAAGLKPYDKIIEINGHNVSKWEDVLNLVKNHNYSEPLQFVVERDDAQQFTFKIQPQETELLTPQGKAEKRKTVGILPLIDFVEPSFTRVDYSFGESVLRAIVRSYEVSLMTVMSFVRLIQNKISPKTIGGVISIGQVASQSFKMGWYHFFNMMAIISINLFVLNLLPIPVLDGGHLLFYTLEAIRGAPISMRKMEIAQQVGLVLLLALMSFALFNDFSRLFGF